MVLYVVLVSAVFDRISAIMQQEACGQFILANILLLALQSMAQHLQVRNRMCSSD